MPGKKIIKIFSLFSLTLYVSILGTIFFHSHIRNIHSNQVSIGKHYENVDPYADKNGICSIEVFLLYNFNSESIAYFNLPNFDNVLDTDLTLVLEFPHILSLSSIDSRAPPFNS
ncbi:hypothetical protein ACSSV9_09920 [Melioribacter sp. OK-6-Me]|uniref:hypothetical protein n=1 Tax=Melioribacter sp. OK-6-Me TaxID=3423433 RepID=UPI003ED934AF